MHDLFLGQSFGVNMAADKETCGNQERCEINVISSGNPDLKPEESIAYNMGVISQVTKDLSFRLDYWDIEIKNKVSSLAVQTILNNEEQYASLINRDNLGRLNTDGAYVRSILENLTSEHSAGVEFGMNYAQRTSLGRFSSTLLVNKLIKSLAQTGDGQPLCDYAKYSTVNGHLTLDWTDNVFSAGSTVRYKGAYTSYNGGLVEGSCEWKKPESEYKVGAVTELDFRIGYNAPFGTDFSMGVINATDADPAFDPNARWPWYNQGLYSNMGAQYYFAASHKFE
jgi:iron complex outermembrane receptor protein